LRAARHEAWLSAAKFLAEHTFKRRSAAETNAQDYGKIFVRTAFLLNGGAILAILTFISSLYGKGDHATTLVAISFSRSVFPAFVLYLAGLVSIALTAAIGYVNWLFVSASFMDEADLFHFMHSKPPAEHPKGIEFNIGASLVLALALAFGALGCFAWASVLVANSLRVLGAA